jgi:hypothetical protein
VDKDNGEGKKKKRSRSKERHRESRKRKRDKHHSKDRNHHKRSSKKKSNSSSSSESGEDVPDAKPKGTSYGLQLLREQESPEPLPLENPIEATVANDCNVLDNKCLEENIPLEINLGQVIEETPVPKIDPVREDAESDRRGIIRFDTIRRERVPEIAPFRIEPRNNLLLRENKLARPFSSPFKRIEESAKPPVFIPVEAEKETVDEVLIEKSDSTPKINSTEPKLEEVVVEKNWDVIGATPCEVIVAPEDKPESKRRWSSSPSSSSRSSR